MQDQRRRHALPGAFRLQSQRQAEVVRRLRRSVLSVLQRADERLESLRSRLQALDPKRVLSRGYAWISDEQGQPVVRARGLVAGQQVTAVWADGQAKAQLQDVHLDDVRQADR
jgi:exodeoxyribonuclease VII large subunit